MIEKLKSIAAKRTKKEWAVKETDLGNHTVFPPIKSICYWHEDDECYVSTAFVSPGDAEFIVTFANCFDEIIAVIEAAEEAPEDKKLSEALENLRKKVSEL